MTFFSKWQPAGRHARPWLPALALAAACGNAATGTAPGSAGSAGAGGNGFSEGGGSGRAGGGSAGAAGAAGDTAGAAGLGPLAPLIEAFCAAARACCSPGGSLAALDNCEAEFAAQSDNLTLVAGGKARVDKGALERCVAAYEGARTACTQADVLTTCHGILRGTVAEHGSCADVLECDRSAGPKVCLKIQGSGSDLGTCVTPPRGVNGEPCAGSCQLGSECSVTASSPDASTPTTLCFEQDGLYCPIGESCAPIVSDGQDCTWNEACGSDGFCVASCAPLAAAGDPCQFNFGCAQGLACVHGTCAPVPFTGSEACVGHPPSFD